MTIHLHHPVTGADLDATEDQAAHLAASGWITRAEWEQRQADAAEKAAAEAEGGGPAKNRPPRGQGGEGS